MISPGEEIGPGTFIARTACSGYLTFPKGW